MTLSLAIAGCGVMGRRHVLGLKKLQEIDRLRFDLVGVCDPIPASAEAMADLVEAQLGVRPQTYADPADLPADVAALDITTSPDLHARIGIQAMQAGRHVQMEKPITLTIPEGRALLSARGGLQRQPAVRREPDLGRPAGGHQRDFAPVRALVVAVRGRHRPRARLG